MRSLSEGFGFTPHQAGVASLAEERSRVLLRRYLELRILKHHGICIESRSVLNVNLQRE